MFSEWDENGLGDAKSDCIRTVQSRPATYAPAGSQVRVTGSITPTWLAPSLMTPGNVQAALAASGYQVIGMQLSGGVIGVSATLTATVALPGDHGSINDVLSVIK